jgi:hypothetical protein
MEEDVLGTRQTVIGTRYDRCSRCGRVRPHQHRSARREAAATEGTIGLPTPPVSSHEETILLCSECATAVAQGEPLHLPPVRTTSRSD